MRPSMRPLLRPILLATVAGSLLATSAAWAQFDAGTTTTGTFGQGDFFIRVQDVKNHTLSDFDVARFFNKARCECNQPITIYVALSQQGLAKQTTVSTTGTLEVWLGTSCNDINLRGGRCTRLATTTIASFLHMSTGRLYIASDARTMSAQPNLGGDPDASFNGTFTNPDCTMIGEVYQQTIWVLIDSDNNGSPDQSDTQAVNIDVRPPPAPDSASISVAAGNQALILNWTGIDSASYPDLVGYQVLCNRGGDLQVFSDGTFNPAFKTCTMPVAPGADGGIVTIDPSFDGGVEALNPLFACSPLLSPTAHNFRLKILQNGITYGAAVVAIDNSGNASVPDVFYDVPIKTKSFYDVYRNDDPSNPGGASGGLCTLGPGATSGGAIGGACAAIALGAILLARRGRKGRSR
jgi:hypothetical protein